MCPTCQTFTECPTRETAACLQCQNQTLKTEQCPREGALAADNMKLIVHSYILYAVIAIMATTIVGLVAGLLYYKRQAARNFNNAVRRSNSDLENPGDSLA